MTAHERQQTLPDGGGRPNWQAGTSSRVITPDRPIMRAGYGDRMERSTGVEADIYATGVALSDGRGTRAVIVGLDLLGVTRELRVAVAKRCEEAFGLPAEALLLNASHTHHGPEYRVDEWGVLDSGGDDDERAREYRKRLENEIVDVVGAALEDRRPVELRYSHARGGFGMNRCRPNPGGFSLDPYPDGPVDTDVPVLLASDDDGVQAVLFGYACHPTSRPKRTTFHPDWSSVARKRIEERYADATAVFLQGCGADPNPYPQRTAAYTDYHGRTLALAVEAAVTAGGRPVVGPLEPCSETVTLAFADQPAREEFERRLSETDGSDRYAGRFLDELERDGDIRTEFPYQVGGIGFGSDLTLVALGGEVPVDYAHEISSALEGDVLVAGFSNHGYLYVPTALILREGGYEASWVFLYWRYPAPLRFATEARIRDTALAVAQRAGATRRQPTQK